MCRRMVRCVMNETKGGAEDLLPLAHRSASTDPISSCPRDGCPGRAVGEGWREKPRKEHASAVIHSTGMRALERDEGGRRTIFKTTLPFSNSWMYFQACEGKPEFSNSGDSSL